MEPTSTVTAAADRFAVAVDGRAAGFAQFVDSGSQRIFFHTVVDDEFAGQGLASTLVTQALDATRAAGLRVVPVCPYVASFLTRHEEYADLADPVTPAAVAAARAASDR